MLVKEIIKGRYWTVRGEVTRHSTTEGDQRKYLGAVQFAFGTYNGLSNARLLPPQATLDEAVAMVVEEASSGG